MKLNRGEKWLVCFGLAVLLLVLSGFAGPAQADSSGLDTFQPPKSLEAAYVPGEVLVKFKDSPAFFRGKPSRGHLRSVQGAEAAEFAAALPDKAQASLERVQGRVVRAHPSIGVLRVKLPAEVSVGQAIEKLYRSGTVEYAEPNVLIKPQAIPDDPLYSTSQGGLPSQWSLPMIKAPEAWDIVYLNPNPPPTYIVDRGSTIVAVIDTGVDYNHVDLAANMRVNNLEIPNNGIDDDDNHFVDDYYGIDTTVTPSSGDPMDTNGHGTAMAGIIGAVGNNATGIAGINWQTRIMALKFMKGNTGDVDGAITCINYALSQAKKTGAHLVMTMGWGQTTSAYSNAMHDALRIAQDSGALAVAAAGNDTDAPYYGDDTDILPNFPSSYNHDMNDFPTVGSITLDNILSVGASDQSDKKVTPIPLQTNMASNYGLATVDLFAPGKDITSTWVGGTYNKGTGTSFAAAHVAGACALLWNKYPDKDWKQIKAMIMNGAEDGAAQDFRAICVTEGRLNLLNSLLVPDNTPAVFSIFGTPAPDSGDPYLVPGRAENGETIVITGVNFGDSPGTFSFLGRSFPAVPPPGWDPTVPYWTEEKITTVLPADLPKGIGRLLVTNAAGLTSRGACFSNISRERQVGSLILARGLAAGAQVGNDMWIIGGRTYWGIVPHVERYSLATNHTVIDSDWMMPTPVSNAGAAAIGSKIYVVGGATEDASGHVLPVADLQIFDTATLTWNSGPPLPQALMQCAVTSLGGKVYAFGGLVKSRTSFTYTAVTDAYVFDPAANSWNSASVAALPTATAYAAAALTPSGKIWVMGGFSGSSMTSQQWTVQEYDPIANQWSLQRHLVRPRGGAAGLVYGGMVYCLRGTEPNLSNVYDEYADGEWYNPALGYWMPSIMNYLGIYVSPPNVLARRGLYTPSPGQYREKIYLLGGATGSDSTYKHTYSNKVWAFPAAGNVSKAKTMPWLWLLLLDD